MAGMFREGTAVVQKRFFAMAGTSHEDGGRWVEEGERVLFLRARADNERRQEIKVGEEVLNMDNPTMNSSYFDWKR